MNRQAMAALVVAVGIVVPVVLALRAEPGRARVSLVPSWPGLAVAPADQVAEMRRRLRPGMRELAIRALGVSKRPVGIRGL